MPEPIGPNFRNLLLSLKPFLNTRAMYLIETLEAVGDLMGSDSGKKAHQAFKALRIGQQQILPAAYEEGENFEEREKE